MKIWKQEWWIGFGIVIAGFSQGAAAWAGEGISPLTIDNVAVMQQRADGQYDIVCRSGAREVASDLDLKLNNVCPQLKKADPTYILSVQQREDGQFDVVCTDLSRKVAAVNDIISGAVCKPTVPAYSLEPGRYSPISGYTSYCPQRITPRFEGNVLKALDVQYVGSCSSQAQYDCTGNVCQYEGSYTYRIEITDKTHYNFSRADGSQKAVFEWKQALE